MIDVLVSWISLHDEALSILLSDVVNEVSLALNHFDLFKSLFTRDFFVVVLVAHRFHVRVFLVHGPVDAPHKSRTNKLIWELSPNVTLEL